MADFFGMAAEEEGRFVDDYPHRGESYEERSQEEFYGDEHPSGEQSDMGGGEAGFEDSGEAPEGFVSDEPEFGQNFGAFQRATGGPSGDIRVMDAETLFISKVKGVYNDIPQNIGGDGKRGVNYISKTFSEAQYKIYNPEVMAYAILYILSYNKLSKNNLESFSKYHPETILREDIIRYVRMVSSPPFNLNFKRKRKR